MEPTFLEKLSYLLTQHYKDSQARVTRLEVTWEQPQSLIGRADEPRFISRIQFSSEFDQFE